MSVVIRRCREGDQAKMAQATPEVIEGWPSGGTDDAGPKFIRDEDGEPCVARINGHLTEAVANDFAAHPACADLGIEWFRDLASVIGYERVLEEI